MRISQALTNYQNPQEVRQYRSNLLGVARAFCFFVFINELLEFIEFGRLDILKRDSECFLSNPLHTRGFDRDRLHCSGNDESHTNHFAWIDFQVTIESGATD